MRAHAVGRVGETVHEQCAANRRARRREDLRAVPVGPEPGRMRESLAVVTIGGQLPCRVQPVLDPFADRAKGLVLDREVIGERRRGLQRPRLVNRAG